MCWQTSESSPMPGASSPPRSLVPRGSLSAAQQTGPGIAAVGVSPAVVSSGKGVPSCQVVFLECLPPQWALAFSFSLLQERAFWETWNNNTT